MADSNGRKSGECTIRINQHGFFGFGITNDLNNILTNRWMWDYPKGKTYYVCSSGAGWSKESTCGQFSYPCWTVGDLIKIEWTEHGILTCHINGNKKGQMNIEKGLTYFLCACTESIRHGSELEILHELNS